MSKKSRTYNGFTLIELMVSMGIFAIIVSGSYISYLNFQRSHSLDNYTTQIIGLIYQAQNQAMSRMCVKSCDIATTGANFGIHFDATNRQIILYTGIVYNPNDDYNIAINLPSNINLISNLPAGDNIVFEKISGEIRDFDDDLHNFSLQENSSGQTKNLDINRLGVIDVN